MVDIKKILCPVDFSDASVHAREHAFALGRWYQSEISALYVMPPRIMPTPPVFFYGPPLPAVSETLPHEAAHARLHDWLKEASDTGLKTATLLDEGDPAASILRHADTMPADLIVMGTHGLAGLDHFVLGSVAEKVLRRSPCPVMTVPPQARSAATVPYTHLLCPVDFSASSLSAFRFAVSIAEESDAHLTILHAIDWSANEGFIVEDFDPPELRRRVESAARGRLEGLVTDEIRTWCQPTVKMVYGKPYRAILEEAGRARADLIVMGVHGRNAVDLALFGSSANHVVRAASCPVLTLRD